MVLLNLLHLRSDALVILFALTWTILSCKKNQDLGSEFEQTIGTYTSIGDPIKITVDKKQKVTCYISAERGYHFRVSRAYIPSQSVIHAEGYEWHGFTLANRDSKGQNLAIYSRPASDTVLIFAGTKVLDFTAFNDRVKFIKRN